MGSAAVKPQEKKKSKAVVPEPAPAESPQFEQITGVPAGLPLFLQGSAISGSGGCSCGRSNGDEECEECRQKRLTLQRESEAGTQPATIPAPVHRVLKGAGAPLERSTARFMESRFNRDFSQVRVHAGPEAAHAAASINAHAFTTGRNIVFGAGRYAPQSDRGKRLLAHELTHVVQQSTTGPSPHQTISHPDDPAEREAREISRHVASPKISHSVQVESRPASDVQRFASTEHEELGDTTGVKTIDLGSGVVLTWGQIVALAGDYYGTVEDLLADTTTPTGRAKIRRAMEAGGLPSAATSGLPAPGPAEETAVLFQYLQLVIHNIPHFLGGGTARETWLEYHARAIDAAIREGLAGTPLNQGYLLEAFGQHFYTDSFSGGHIRTPRKEINDWYSTVFGPRVVDHFIDTLRSRAENEIYWQLGGPAAGLLIPGGDAALRVAIHIKVGEELDDAIAKIDAKHGHLGGHAALAELFGQIVGGMVSGAIHDLEGARGVVVNSKAHPAAWTAYGDGKLDDPRNAVSKAEAVAGVAEAKADIDQAYLIASGERIAKAKVPIPVPSALPSIIYFKFDSSALNASPKTDMAGALAYMTYNPDAEVSIVGYTDPIGTPIYNEGLGQRRADSVASVLLGGGIAKSRVTTTSAGETGLVTTKPADYRLDRRATLTWSSAPPGPAAKSRDVAYERAQAAVTRLIGPPYVAEQRLPEPVAAANPAIPEWHWGKLDPSFQGEIAKWVGSNVRPYVGKILGFLKPIAVAGSITVDPKPIVKGILDDLLADPIDFLNKGFGEKAGP
jgi:outer membrane protein OmpA-like peptidoglycan-associated protein